MIKVSLKDPKIARKYPILWLLISLDKSKEHKYIPYNMRGYLV